MTEKTAFIKMVRIKKKNFYLLLALLLVIFIVTFLVSGYLAAFRDISYLPESKLDFNDSRPLDSSFIKISNTWSDVMIDMHGKIVVTSKKGETIMSNLKYFADYENQKPQLGLDNVSIQPTNDSTISITGNSSDIAEVNLVIIVHTHLPRIDVRVKTHYRKNIIVRRESFVASFDVPLSEVYLKNRKIDKKDFETEYWLNKEGARFGESDRSALIYHTPFISSLQLDKDKKLLFINLEYFADHPHFNIPYQADGSGKWIDLSNANFPKGYEKDNSFIITFGNMPKVTPRLLQVPFGYEAGYVFTEHADGGDIQSNRAIYFGSEDISKSSNAVGGFVGHMIPTTKSVFYTDSSNNIGAAIFDKQNNLVLLDFLDQIYGTGIYDICLHTPEGNNSYRKVLEESIGFMKARYDSKTWIDHGFFSGNNNREAFVADGLDSNSSFFAGDLWEKFNTRYFWSPASELIRTSSRVSISSKLKAFRFYEAYVSFWQRNLTPRELKELTLLEAIKELRKRYSYDVEVNSLLSELREAYPKPLYWQHPTRTNQFYSWTTDVVKDYKKISQKEVDQEIQHLKSLINNRSVFLNHGYYVRNKPANDLLNERDGKLIINPYFDKILAEMAKMRNNGDLYVTTIRDLLDYWISLDKIAFEYLPNGDINILNNSNKPVFGLSIAVSSAHAKIVGTPFKIKKVGVDTIIWFDIEANEVLKFTAH